MTLPRIWSRFHFMTALFFTTTTPSFGTRLEYMIKKKRMNSETGHTKKIPNGVKSDYLVLLHPISPKCTKEVIILCLKYMIYYDNELSKNQFTQVSLTTTQPFFLTPLHHYSNHCKKKNMQAMVLFHRDPCISSHGHVPTRELLQDTHGTFIIDRINSIVYESYGKSKSVKS